MIEPLGARSANIHGTALSIGGEGILIRGAAQGGKSSLCLSLLRRAEQSARRASLVADDRVEIALSNDRILMRAPAVLRGLIEIAGVGILRQPSIDDVALSLVVDLVPADGRPRFPDAADRSTELLGRSLRRIRLPERDAAFSADIILTILPADDYV